MITTGNSLKDESGVGMGIIRWNCLATLLSIWRIRIVVGKSIALIKNLGYITASTALLVLLLMFTSYVINGGHQFLTGGKNIFRSENNS